MYKMISIMILLCLIFFRTNAYADNLNVWEVIRTAGIIDNSNTSTPLLKRIKNDNEESWHSAVVVVYKRISGHLFGKGTVKLERLYKDKEVLEETIQCIAELEKLFTIQSNDEELEIVEILKAAGNKLLVIMKTIIDDPDHKQARLPE